MELDPQNRQLTILVHIGDILSGTLELGFSRSLESNEIHPELIKEVGLTQSDLDAVIAELPKATEDAMVMLQDGGG